MLDGLGAPHALLVQPRGYGLDKAAMLDAMRRPWSLHGDRDGQPRRQ
jgi:hypothetical protein